MATSKTSVRFKRRVCRQCGNDLLRISPNRPTDDLSWNAKPEGKFYCEKCQIYRTFPLVQDEPRDIQLSPRAQA